MTQVLARKWRPRTFAELVGQEHVVRALANALSGGRLHHAYLFTGTRGVGKTTLARILAKALNCETGVTAEPCGRCAACAEIDGGRFVDLIELDAASHTQVDNMRELLENALYAPTAGRYKVYIIDEVHMLSRNAFNAMLKTLEEPPDHVKFVLATTDPQRVPVTVLSRCLQFNLKQIPPREIGERLRHVLDAEGIGHESAALAVLGRAAQGSLRDALSLLDQAIAHGGGTVTEGGVRAMLGTVRRESLFAILTALAAGDGPALVAEADRMAGAGASFDAGLQEIATLLQRIAVAQLAPESVGADDPEREALRALAQRLAPEDVQLYYEIAIQGRSELACAPDELAGFTMTLIRMLAFSPGGEPPPQRPVAAPARRAGGTPAPEAPGAREAGDPAAERAAPADWAALLARLRVKGMARNLAEHCELVASEPGRVELKIARAHQHLLEKQYQERLKAALDEHFGGPVRLAIAVSEQAASAPAAVADRERGEKQVQAIAAIEQDPFVRELVENFDARVVESSIRPRESGVKGDA
ncbi:MAG: DNA polymerase III subunit gamma/tau [Burkholderiales bacterium]|nr:DNA polymerase III subunit gamma/tau [Burkholderiales bacterium]